MSSSEKPENAKIQIFIIFFQKFSKKIEKIEKKLEKKSKIVLTKCMRDGALYPLGVVEKNARFFRRISQL